MIYRNILGFLDLAGFVLMLWSCIRITTKWGFRTKQERWALIRRSIYFSMSMSLVALAFKRLLEHYSADDFAGFLAQVSIVMGIIIFPLMRALGFTTQDVFILSSQRRRYHSRRARYFANRAEECHAHADNMNDTAEMKQQWLSMASHYEFLADQAERRAREQTRHADAVAGR